jgi:hypothetical protein
MNMRPWCLRGCHIASTAHAGHALAGSAEPSPIPPSSVFGGCELQGNEVKIGYAAVGGGRAGTASMATAKAEQDPGPTSDCGNIPQRPIKSYNLTLISSGWIRQTELGLKFAIPFTLSSVGVLSRAKPPWTDRLLNKSVASRPSIFYRVIANMRDYHAFPMPMYTNPR